MSIRPRERFMSRDAVTAPSFHEVEAHLVVEARPRRVIPIGSNAARDVLGAHLPALLVENLRSMRGDVRVTTSDSRRYDERLSAGLEPAIFSLGGRRLVH